MRSRLRAAARRRRIGQAVASRWRAIVLSLGLLASLGGCGGGGKTGSGSRSGAATASTQGAPRASRTTLGLSSSAFLNGSSIPARYTCDGENIPPPLTWTRVPVRARSLALLLEDPDAPGGTFVHWSLYDLPPGSSGLASGRVPSGSVEGENSSGHSGYTGPCPPRGDPAHHYVFSLYALDDHPDLPTGASAQSVRQAIAGHAIATGTLTGLYRRP